MYQNSTRRLATRAHSRTESRLRVALPAVLTTRDGTRRVLLEDLSARGARISGDIPYNTGEEAVLQWSRFEAHGAVWWFGEDDCGLHFFEPVPVEHLLATRDFTGQTRPLDERTVVGRTAAAFASGRLRL